MILQQIIALFHHLDKHLAVFVHTKMRLYRLACYIVGRSQRAYIGRTVIPYQTMTVAYTAVESEFIRTELFVNELYKLCGFFSRYIIGTVVEYCLILVNRLVRQRYKIRSERNVRRFHINAYTSCL